MHHQSINRRWTLFIVHYSVAAACRYA